ncbi:hypothetical protein A3K72_01075, partial [Candidatus Woesearchaeota archaeon RBG_13_36_6]
MENHLEIRKNNCIVCNSNRHKLFCVIENDKVLHKEVKYYKCTDCGLLFIDPQPLDELNEIYKTYGIKHPYKGRITLKKKLFFFLPFSYYWRKKIKFLTKRIKKKGTILDIGSSEGKFLYLLKLRGWKPTGIEPNLYYSKFANNVLKVPIICTNIENYNSNNKFDLITMLDLFEHIPKPIETIQKIRNMLKEDGHLYLLVPTVRVNSLMSMHLFMYNEHNIVKLLDKCGFITQSMDID